MGRAQQAVSTEAGVRLGDRFWSYDEVVGFEGTEPRAVLEALEANSRDRTTRRRAASRLNHGKGHNPDQ